MYYPLAIYLFLLHGDPIAGGLLQTTMQLAALVIVFSIGRRFFNVTMLIDGQSEGLPLRYFLDGWNIHALGVEHYDRAERLYIVVEPGLGIRRINPYELSAFGAYDIAKTWSVGHGIQMHRLQHHRQ